MYWTGILIVPIFEQYVQHKKCYSNLFNQTCIPSLNDDAYQESIP